MRSMKNMGRAAKYFERTFNYTLRETKLAKAPTGSIFELLSALLAGFLCVLCVASS